MRRLARLALLPALRLARASLVVDERGAPRPVDPPRAHARGGEAVRILIVGNGAALGIGVRRHDLALPGGLARAVSARTGRGVDVDLVAAGRLTLRNIAAAVRDRGLARYDVVVVVVGEDAALDLMPRDCWRRRLGRALAELRVLSGPAPLIVVAGVPANHGARAIPSSIARLADAHAAELDRVTREVCDSSPRVRFAALSSVGPDVPPEIRAVEEFALWAGLISEQVVQEAPRGPGSALLEVDEVRRQAAVDRLLLANSGSDARLRYIVETARRIFGTETAMFTVLDGDVQLNVASAGGGLVQVSRSHSFCSYAILERGGMIVEDARSDARFRDNPLVTGEPHIRFYAGFPVESPDGERVGALCVFDSSPRRVHDVNAGLLRELAHLVQRELWRCLPRTATREVRLRPFARPQAVPTSPQPAAR